MPWTKFLLYTFLGSFPWCVGLAYGGYALGDNWERIDTVASPIAIAIAVIIGLVIIFFVWRRIKQVRAQP